MHRNGSIDFVVDILKEVVHTGMREYCEHFKKHTPERPDIARFVSFLLFVGFWRGVARCALVGKAFGLRRVKELGIHGAAKVTKQQFSLVYKDIGGLDVFVSNELRMQPSQAKSKTAKGLMQHGAVLDTHRSWLDKQIVKGTFGYRQN